MEKHGTQFSRKNLWQKEMEKEACKQSSLYACCQFLLGRDQRKKLGKYMFETHKKSLGINMNIVSNIGQMFFFFVDMMTEACGASQVRLFVTCGVIEGSLIPIFTMSCDLSSNQPHELCAVPPCHLGHQEGVPRRLIGKQTVSGLRPRWRADVFRIPVVSSDNSSII